MNKSFKTYRFACGMMGRKFILGTLLFLYSGKRIDLLYMILQIPLLFGLWNTQVVFEILEYVVETVPGVIIILGENPILFLIHDVRLFTVVMQSLFIWYCLK